MTHRPEMKTVTIIAPITDEAAWKLAQEICIYKFSFHGSLSMICPLCQNIVALIQAVDKTAREHERLLASKERAS